tara:strand:+ start:251 stop:481 length:231 start_codon:yes stop_codon:yes gene_type:complete
MNKILKRLVEEINLILRGYKGYGAGHPWSPKKSTGGLGKSYVEEYIEQNEERDDKEKPKRITVSKVFSDEDEQDSV